jgi:lysine 2,3-aminomutase
MLIVEQIFGFSQLFARGGHMIKKDGSLTRGRDHRKIPIWADVSSAEWDDWNWQLKNRITSVEQLKQVVEMTEKEQREVNTALTSLRMAITPYFASLMDASNRDCPIRRRAIPAGKEVNLSPEDMVDPLP